MLPTIKLGVREMLGIGKTIKKVGTAWKLYSIWRSIDMGKLKSKKFWVTIATGVVTVFAESLGVKPDHVQWLVGLVGAYLLGQGIADHGKEAEKAKRMVEE